MAGDPPLLKDMIDDEAVAALGAAVRSVHPFDEGAFMGAVFDEDWDSRALKQRVRHVATVFHDLLPEPYPEALGVLREAADGMRSAGMAAWALCDFVEVYGLDHPELSLPALEQFTTVISAEFAVRPFIARYPERMMRQHHDWASHADPAVRRLASEGARPRLPWGMALRDLQADPAPLVPILESLRADPSADVRRSVANNLNDISRDHPDLVVSLLTSWQDDSPEMAELTKHALRSLLKQGHPEALALLGFTADAEFEVTALAVDPTLVPVGGATSLKFELRPTAEGRHAFMVDYAITYQNYSQTGSRKVFKGTTAERGRGEPLEMHRRISLASRSTRTIYPGRHRVEVLVNGSSAGTVEFEVVS